MLRISKDSFEKVLWGNFYFLYSGQSGSGKTEATKLIVHYLSSMYQGINSNLRQVNWETNTLINVGYIIISKQHYNAL